MCAHLAVCRVPEGMGDAWHASAPSGSPFCGHAPARHVSDHPSDADPGLPAPSSDEPVAGPNRRC
jgi:hypothetical protein